MDLLLIIIIVLPLVANLYIKGAYSKYKQKSNLKEMTGFDVARKILDSNGLNEVLILETDGELSDHYNPRRKVVKLSRDIYNGETIAAMSVAAHECGHALQDKDNYWFLKLRTLLVPIVNICSNIGYIFVVIGFVLEYFDLFFLGIGLSMFGVLFNLATLVVEFDASNRAAKEMERLNITTEDTVKGSKSMLKAAAFTYVAALLTNILQLLRFVMIMNSRRD